jgi:hypothetical protein
MAEKRLLENEKNVLIEALLSLQSDVSKVEETQRELEGTLRQKQQEYNQLEAEYDQERTIVTQQRIQLGLGPCPSFQEELDQRNAQYVRFTRLTLRLLQDKLYQPGSSKSTRARKRDSTSRVTSGTTIRLSLKRSKTLDT